MTRYLLFISYIGSQFRGVQKQAVSAEPSKLDAETIQGILEICSKRFNPANEPTVCVSSRTDKGVHALRSSAHVDLIRKSNLIYEPAYLAAGYNKQLAKLDLDLRVQDVKLVPDTFHARFSAKSRTYLYRLAVRRPDAPPANGSHYRDIPYIEKNRCHFIQHMQQFNISALKDAALLFPGSRDFRTFMGSKARLPEEVSTVKEMYSLDIVTGSPLLSPKYCPSAAYYDYWDVVCHAKSFLYRQVRRIVGALIAVAEGRISVDDIQYMLDNPSKDSWNTRIPVVPPHGLYLVDVEYDPADLVLSEDTSKQDSLLSSSSSSSSSEVRFSNLNV